jgi:hypothetical protein
VLDPHGDGLIHGNVSIYDGKTGGETSDPEPSISISTLTSISISLSRRANVNNANVNKLSF